MTSAKREDEVQYVKELLGVVERDMEGIFENLSVPLISLYFIFKPLK